MAGVIVLIIVASLIYYFVNALQPTLTRHAKVVGKRTSVRGGENSMTSTSYYCTFEFDDGARTEYHLNEGQFALLAEGDWGNLDTRGALFWGFRRGH